MALDILDQKILQHLTTGICSYEELAHICNVTRNTVYRRISALENKGIIKNTLSCVVDLEQLGLTPIAIGAKVPQICQDKAINLLAVNSSVRFLWRTFGDHNLTLVAFCGKGQEGGVIQAIRAVLEELNAENICVSVGFVWEKMNYSAFDENLEIEEKINQIIEKKILVT
jgi:DNA-binding Lrp family transcriptional regulator